MKYISVSIELTMSQWASLFTEKGLGVSKVVGDLLGPCLFAILMGIGRTIYGILGNKVQIERALLYSGLLCVICYLVTALAFNPFLSLLGCAVCGLLISLMWPGTFSMSAKYYPQGGVMMFGLLAIAGDVGASIGPWIAGVISDIVQTMNGIDQYMISLSAEQIGLKAGLLVAIIFPLLLCVGILLLKKGDIKKC